MGDGRLRPLAHSAMIERIAERSHNASRVLPSPTHKPVRYVFESLAKFRVHPDQTFTAPIARLRVGRRRNAGLRLMSEATVVIIVAERRAAHGAPAWSLKSARSVNPHMGGTASAQDYTRGFTLRTVRRAGSSAFAWRLKACSAWIVWVWSPR